MDLKNSQLPSVDWLSRTIASQSANVCLSKESIRGWRNSRALSEGNRIETSATRLDELRTRGPTTPDRFEFVEQRDQTFREIAAGEPPRPLLATASEFIAFWFVVGKKFESVRNFQFVSRIHADRRVCELLACAGNIGGDDRTSQAKRFQRR